jgi:hypothetical protein
MKDLSALQSKLQASSLRLVTQRDGASVYEAQIACGTIFVKAFTDHISCDRDCEILEALAEFSLTPNVLTRFDWDNHAVVVTNALSGSQVDHRLQSCSRTTKISLLGAAGAALGNLHRQRWFG